MWGGHDAWQRRQRSSGQPTRTHLPVTLTLTSLQLLITAEWNHVGGATCALNSDQLNLNASNLRLKPPEINFGNDQLKVDDIFKFKVLFENIRFGAFSLPPAATPLFNKGPKTKLITTEFNVFNWIKSDDGLLIDGFIIRLLTRVAFESSINSSTQYGSWYLCIKLLICISLTLQ